MDGSIASIDNSILTLHQHCIVHFGIDVIAFDGQYSETNNKNSNNEQFHFYSPRMEMDENGISNLTDCFSKIRQTTLNTVCQLFYSFQQMKTITKCIADLFLGAETTQVTNDFVYVFKYD